MNEDNAAEKEHAPSQKRLDDARKRGEVPKSAELITAAGNAGLLLAGLTVGAGLLLRAGEIGAMLLGQADRMAPLMLGSARPVTGGLMLSVAGVFAPLFLVPMGAALLAVLAQRALVFAPEKLQPKLTRISPLANAGQKFGREGLMTFAQSTAKLVLVSLLLGVFMVRHADTILMSLQMTPAQSSAAMLQILLDFLFLTLLIGLVFGGFDLFWQINLHSFRNRMSRKELMDEMKDNEGDPQLKQQRRQRGQEIATNRMLLDVGRADVVIVNPTHYAVALKWRRSDRTAPICLAKGTDEMAARIREKAAEAGVPLHNDPPTARALHASVAIGSAIRPEHYRAVAAAIRFSEAMRKRQFKGMR